MAVEPAPPLIGEELRQRLAQELGIEVARILHPAVGEQPFPELAEQLLAPGEARLLEVGRRLESGVALERGAKLVEHPAAEPETAVVGAGLIGCHGL